ncbi:hypothetical protein KK062_00720 [Fulvivirgaceae bacterium PWU5]|uniref:DUF3052 domain-containing protein n=1 Tax=Dawidia cretensis TaxID=2782350 RepID=A0AAP2DUN8_9BACT|nr:hypothetical protein [Dawidia cretensis]MBT1706719.1 hypothetical protein [Dawidia cretensis]
MPGLDSVFKKLNYKDQATLYIIDAPESFVPNMKGMEAFATIKTSLTGARQVNFILAFVKTQRQIDGMATKVPQVLEDDAVLWFAYPKGTSKKYTCDFNRDTGWNAFGTLGFEPVRMVAIDEDWSALRLRRVEHIKTMTRSFAMSEAGKKKVEGAKNAPKAEAPKKAAKGKAPAKGKSAK